MLQVPPPNFVGISEVIHAMVTEPSFAARVDPKTGKAPEITAPPAFVSPAEILEAAMGGFYPSGMLTTNVRVVDKNKVEVTFAFPAAIPGPLNSPHVSSVKMFEAMLEGLFICAASSILHGAYEEPMTIAQFRDMRREGTLVMYEVERLQYRKMLDKGSEGKLTFTLTDQDVLGDFRRCRYKIDGFKRGSVLCIQPRVSETAVAATGD